MDIYPAIELFSSVILKGLEEKNHPPEATFGNAFDEKYKLENLLS
jgi:hypothetical protein